MDKPAQLSAERQRLLAERLKGFARVSIESRRIPRRPAGPAPLSFGQHQMWVIDQMIPGNPAYNLPVAYRICGELDVRALEVSFNQIIQRHALLLRPYGQQRAHNHQPNETKFLHRRHDRPVK